MSARTSKSSVVDVVRVDDKSEADCAGTTRSGAAEQQVAEKINTVAGSGHLVHRSIVPLCNAVSIIRGLVRMMAVCSGSRFLFISMLLLPRTVPTEHYCSAQQDPRESKSSAEPGLGVNHLFCLRAAMSVALPDTFSAHLAMVRSRFVTASMQGDCCCLQYSRS